MLADGSISSVTWQLFVKILLLDIVCSEHKIHTDLVQLVDSRLLFDRGKRVVFSSIAYGKVILQLILSIGYDSDLRFITLVAILCVPSVEIHGAKWMLVPMPEISEILLCMLVRVIGIENTQDLIGTLPDSVVCIFSNDDVHFHAFLDGKYLKFVMKGPCYLLVVHFESYGCIRVWNWKGCTADILLQSLVGLPTSTKFLYGAFLQGGVASRGHRDVSLIVLLYITHLFMLSVADTSLHLQDGVLYISRDTLGTLWKRGALETQFLSCCGYAIFALSSIYSQPHPSSASPIFTIFSHSFCQAIFILLLRNNLQTP